MKAIDKKIDDLKPYENNPRRNDQAVEYVANSISMFGFKVPIIIDKDNVIVTGHTRYKAAKLLGLEEVPCIIADDLTPDQVAAFRLADNKVGEIAQWDQDMLMQELEKITDIDMEKLDFSWAERYDPKDFFNDPEPPKPKMKECPHCGELFEVE